jgi:hypothetical protein
MFSGLMSSVKGWMGWDNLPVESGGGNEDNIQHNNTDERQSLFKQLSGFIGKDITSMISLPVWVFEPISFLEVLCEPMQFEEVLQKVSKESHDQYYNSIPLFFNLYTSNALNQAATSPDSTVRLAYLSA